MAKLIFIWSLLHLCLIATPVWCEDKDKEMEKPKEPKVFMYIEQEWWAWCPHEGVDYTWSYDNCLDKCPWTCTFVNDSSIKFVHVGRTDLDTAAYYCGKLTWWQNVLLKQIFDGFYYTAYVTVALFFVLFFIKQFEIDKRINERIHPEKDEEENDEG